MQTEPRRGKANRIAAEVPFTILVADDQPLVLRVITSILFQAGYEVLGALSAQEALRLGREHEGPIHLALIDMVMPGMSGLELS